MEKQVTSTQGSDLSDWLSTYGLITVEKILERYGIHLSVEDLRRAVTNPNCLFFRIIQVPLKNVFNGLILQQAKDYQIYAQKLFIDYLLSGESSQEGSQVRDDLEETRKDLVNAGEVFREEESVNDKLIARSQKLLIHTMRLFNSQILLAAKKMKQDFQRIGTVVQDEKMFVKVFYTLLTEYNSDTQLPSQHPAWLRVEKLIGQSFDLSLRQALRAEVVKLNQIDSETGAALQEFSDQALIATANMKKFRSDFSASIIKTNELLTMVSGYSLNEQQLATNQEDLYFDAKIGE